MDRPSNPLPAAKVVLAPVTAASCLLIHLLNLDTLLLIRFLVRPAQKDLTSNKLLLQPCSVSASYGPPSCVQ